MAILSKVIIILQMIFTSKHLEIRQYISILFSIFHLRDYIFPLNFLTTTVRYITKITIIIKRRYEIAFGKIYVTGMTITYVLSVYLFSDGWFANDPAFAHYYDDAPTSGRSDPGAIDFLG